MGLKDAVAEKGVGGVDGAAEAEGGVYPVGARVGMMEVNEWGEREGDLHRRGIAEVILIWNIQFRGFSA